MAKPKLPDLHVGRLPAFAAAGSAVFALESVIGFGDHFGFGIQLPECDNIDGRERVRSETQTAGTQGEFEGVTSQTIAGVHAAGAVVLTN